MNTFYYHHDSVQGNKSLWKSELTAFSLALLVHALVWQVYRAYPPQVTEEPIPPFIEASLVTLASPAPVTPSALPSAQPQPQPLAAPKRQVKPPPAKPKPIPKLEKPVLKKPEKPRPVDRTRSEEPREEVKPTQEPVQESIPQPPAPTETRRPPVKAAGESSENTAYHPGGLSGLKKRFPRAAMERGLEGTVTLKVHIQADGDIGEVIVVNSSGHEILDDQAVDLIKEAHATPARRGDKNVDSWVIVPYHFRLEK
jgi:protein TonB